MRDQQKSQIWASVYGVKSIVEAKQSKEITSVSDIRAGKFTNQKVPKMALEVIEVEAVGTCFQMKLRDIFEEEISASFQSSTREVVNRQVRKGKIIKLKEVGLFNHKSSKLGSSQTQTILIVLSNCITEVCKG